MHEIEALLSSPERAQNVGKAARKQVLSRYSWDAHLSIIDRYLDPLRRVAPDAAVAAPGVMQSSG